jgi:hypothetical protein
LSWLGTWNGGWLGNGWAGAAGGPATENEKLGLMEWEDVWEPGLPLSPGTLGQDDRQQLLWGYPGVLWNELGATDNEKLAFMEWEDVWEPAIPLSPGTFGQDDQQQLLWGYPGILWGLKTTAQAFRKVINVIHSIRSRDVT